MADDEPDIVIEDGEIVAAKESADIESDSPTRTIGGGDDDSGSGGGGSSSGGSEISDGGSPGINEDPISRPPTQEEPITRPPEQEEPITRPPQDDNDVDFSTGGSSGSSGSSGSDVSDGGSPGINEDPISQPPEIDNEDTTVNDGGEPGVNEEPLSKPPGMREPEPGTAKDEALEANRLTEPPGQDAPTNQKVQEIVQQRRRRQKALRDIRQQAGPAANPEAAAAQPPTVVEKAPEQFFNPNREVDEDLDFSEEAVIAGQGIIRDSTRFAENIVRETPTAGRTDPFTQTARTITGIEQFLQGDKKEAAAAVNPFVETSAERENIRTLETGTVQGPGTLAGFTFAGTGAVTTSVEENAKPSGIATAAVNRGFSGIGTELAFSTQQDVKQGSGVIASQAAEDPAEFVLEETGEEIGEGIATGGIGLLTTTITPTITPETTLNPAEGTVGNLRFSQVRTPQGIQTSEVQTGGATTGTGTGNNLQDFIPEETDLPDLGEQTIGQSRRNILEEPESQLRGQNLLEEDIIGQPEQGREAGVPEEQAGLREEEVQVLEQRRERQPGVERVESEITEFGEPISEQPTATEVEFTTEDTITQRFQDQESQDSGLQGVLGGRRKGQTRGIPLIPDQDTGTTPESGFDQTRTGRVETENIDTEINIIESRETADTFDSSSQQPEVQANSPDLSLELGLTPTLEQVEELANQQKPGQQQPQDQDTGQEEDTPQQFRTPTTTETFEPGFDPFTRKDDPPRADIPIDRTPDTPANFTDRPDNEEDVFAILKDDSESSQRTGNDGQFASSLTAGLFDIEAEEDFDEDQQFTGFDIRPLVDEENL